MGLRILPPIPQPQVGVHPEDKERYERAKHLIHHHAPTLFRLRLFHKYEEAYRLWYHIGQQADVFNARNPVVLMDAIHTYLDDVNGGLVRQLRRGLQKLYGMGGALLRLLRLPQPKQGGSIK